MPTPSLFQDWLSGRVAPTWLQVAPGDAFLRSIALTSGDLVGNGAAQAVAARIVESGPADALPYSGADRSLERYPGDTDATYRARLGLAWSLWPNGGTATGILASLTSLGFVNVSLWNNRTGPYNVAPWPPDGATTNWSRLWVYFRPPFPAFAPWKQRLWADGGRWAQLGPDGTPYTWGSTATAGQVQLIRRLIRKWKCANEICAGIWIELPINGQAGTAANIVTGAAAGNMRVTGLTGMTANSVGHALTITGAAVGANNSPVNVSFPIVAFNSATSVDVANNCAVPPDANNGAIAWNENFVLKGAGS